MIQFPVQYFSLSLTLEPASCTKRFATDA